MDIERLKSVATIGFIVAAVLVILFVFVIRKLKEKLQVKPIKEPDDAFYLNLKSALEKQQALNREVKLREEFQKAILDNISVGVAVFDKFKKIRNANRFFENLFGLKGDYVGKTLIDLNFPEKFHLFVKSLNFSMLFKPFETEIKDGDKTYQVRVSKIDYYRGIEGFLLLVNDITELETAKKRLEVKNRLEYIGEMSANMAHEFKNSLTTVKGYAQMISAKAENESNEKIKGFAEKMIKEIETINEVVNKFLLYAKPLSLNEEEIDAKEFCRELGETFSRFGFLEFSIKPQHIKFQGDKILLRQCLSNLILNAVESVENTESPKVKVSVTQENSSVVISVKDNGKGIKKEDLSKIFIPFFTTKKNGTGLGLAICEKIVARHNGTLEVISEENKGTEVIIRL